MYEVLNTFKWKPIPKFQWKLINFEKPQKFSKTPKSKFQNMKCRKNERLEAYQEKKILKKLEKSQRTRFVVREIVFGRWIGADKLREIEEMRTRSQRMNI